MNIDLELPGNKAIGSIEGQHRISDEMMSAIATFALAEETRTQTIVLLLKEDEQDLMNLGFDKKLLKDLLHKRMGVIGR